MDESDPKFISDTRAQLEKHGAAQVRLLMQTGNWSTTFKQDRS